MSDVDRQVTRLTDVDSLPLAVSDDAVVQLLGAAFARAPLPAHALRDARLVAFLLDIDLEKVRGNSVFSPSVLGPINRVYDRLVSSSGISLTRVRMAIARLTQAGILELSSESSGACYRFMDEVLHPVRIEQYVDWLAVLSKLSGQAPALVVLRAVLDLLHGPWEWERLTYEAIALHACYSVGMAQRSLLNLVSTGVLERTVHAGRGHDYRLTQWALGRGSGVQDFLPKGDLNIVSTVGSSAPLVASAGRTEAVRVLAASPGGLADSSPMIVEIGGLIVRVPIGTEIHMTLGPDGTPVYQLGADMRITRRGSTS